jgi:GNAT superfamily N-acetyltransferase
MHAQARELLDQYITMWQVFTEDHGNLESGSHPGLVLRWTDSAFPFWNMIFLDEEDIPVGLLEARLRAASAYMQKRSCVGFVNVFAEQLDKEALHALPGLAARAGLEFGLYQHAMAADILPLPEPTHPDLRFARVRTDEDLRAYADLNSRGYGFALEMGRAGLVGSTLWKSERMQTWLALRGTEPVACAATVEDCGNLFLALVATAPDSRRKGYGEAVVRKALHEGSRTSGLKRATLHASDAGLPLYERIGYRKVGTIYSFRR